MSNSFNVFGYEVLPKDLDRTAGILERKLDARLIKTRDAGGGVKLDYIGGHTVIRLLNEAFQYKWSFEIIQDEVIESVPKQVTEWNQQARKKLPVLNPDGTPKLEAQPPVVKVLGRLTVPGYGIKEQYGSKVLIGGASEQEAAFKSASTDALKKCATMFGIGLELYEDDDEGTAVTGTTANASPAPASTYSKPAQKQYSKPVEKQTAQATSYDPADIERIRELKAILGATDNAELDPYVREFMDDAKANFLNIGPNNIKAFNVFLSKKAQSA